MALLRTNPHFSCSYFPAFSFYPTEFSKIFDWFQACMCGAGPAPFVCSSYSKIFCASHHTTSNDTPHSHSISFEPWLDSCYWFLAWTNICGRFRQICGVYLVYHQLRASISIFRLFVVWRSLILITMLGFVLPFLLMIICAVIRVVRLFKESPWSYELLPWKDSTYTLKYIWVELGFEKWIILFV